MKAGIDEQTAEREACQMEHALSEESFAKLKSLKQQEACVHRMGAKFFSACLRHAFAVKERLYSRVVGADATALARASKAARGVAYSVRHSDAFPMQNEV